VPFYSALPSVVSTPGDRGRWAAAPESVTAPENGETTRMVAVPVSALAWPVREGSASAEVPFRSWRCELRQPAFSQVKGHFCCHDTLPRTIRRWIEVE
jgi:hypothetical protein